MAAIMWHAESIGNVGRARNSAYTLRSSPMWTKTCWRRWSSNPSPQWVFIRSP